MTSEAVTAGTALSGADDLLVHQLARPFAQVAERSPSWFDRFYFNLHAPGPGPSLVLGAGRYANAGVMDGYACLVVDGQQRNLRVARRVGPGEAPTSIGPLTWDVLEPLRRWRLVVNGGVEGFSLDVVYTARAQPYLVEPIAVAHADGPPTEFSHFFQPGRYEGELRVDGVVHDVAGWWGMRDRSWGVRRTQERLGLHLWGGAQLEDRCIAVLYNEGRDGRPVHVDGAVLPEGGGAPEPIVAVEHDLRTDARGEFTDGRVRARLATGEAIDVDWAALAPGIYMAPAGYGGWHGQDRGALHVEHERMALGESVVLRDMSLALTDKLCSCRVGEEAGTGIFELAISRSRSYTYRPTLTG
ncbi:MAG TPA: hypothetical protein VFG42_24330 [Baekduia sp.]|uniref:hypothetical protein n=1 Tax=Baekduia sp. TaxID=2600305 RepID=UPI002D78283D|nr:hypothetical protein [Baekduia sp.]HET6509943.1 hypothetical protein [Baekduia sp.]